MPNTLKQEMEKEFDKEKNYDAILAKTKAKTMKKAFRIRYVSIPICAIVIAILGIQATNMLKPQDAIMQETSKWQEKEVYVNSMTESDIAIVPRWEDLTICEQFPTVAYHNKNYNCKNGKVPAQDIGDNLGSATLTGYDTYTKKAYTQNATLYAINTLSQECAIAVQFEGTTDYYAYSNAYYSPKTLGNFIEDLNLKEIISLGSVWYEDSYSDKEGNFYYDTIEFPNVEDETIWNMLFSDTSLKNIYHDTLVYHKIMTISVDIPILGYKNIGCSVTEEGYLVTNILDTGKAFEIGKEKVQEFVNYILDNYEGYKIIYVDANENRSDNTSISGEGDNIVEEQIVTVENTMTDNVISHSIGE